MNNSSVDGSTRRTPVPTARSILCSVLGPQLMENLYWTLSTVKTLSEKKSLSSDRRSSMSKCTPNADSTLLKLAVVCKGVHQKWEVRLQQVLTWGIRPLTKVLPIIRVPKVLRTFWTRQETQWATPWLWVRTTLLCNNLPRELPPKYFLPSSPRHKYLAESKGTTSSKSPVRTSSTSLLLFLRCYSKYFKGGKNFKRTILTLPQSTWQIAMSTTGWLKLKMLLANLSALTIFG